jgi:hypothetical protein
MKKIFEYKKNDNIFILNYIGIFNQYTYITIINNKITIDNCNRFNAKNILVLYRTIRNTKWDNALSILHDIK